jgi:hypothetical protein
VFCTGGLLIVDAGDIHGGLLFSERHWMVLPEAGVFGGVLEISQGVDCRFFKRVLFCD